MNIQLKIKEAIRLKVLPSLLNDNISRQITVMPRYNVRLYNETRRLHRRILKISSKNTGKQSTRLTFRVKEPELNVFINYTSR